MAAVGAGTSGIGSGAALQQRGPLRANNSLPESTSFHCLRRGTRILTSDGERCVEDIAVGDRVVTERGKSLPVKRIHRHSFRKETGSSWHHAIIPIRISPFALDEGIPHTDLYLSPAHALFIDGALIPAIHLVNGISIVQAMPEDNEEIEYFHIELETHQVIFAEGAPVETLLATNLRPSDNHPAMIPYAPIVCYNGGRSELKALLRRATSVLVDIRDPVQMAYDRAAARAPRIRLRARVDGGMR